MTRLTLPLLISTLILSGCGRLGDSGWNPLGWNRGASGPTTLEPEGGYAAPTEDRSDIPQILSAEWQPLSDGRLLIVRGFAPVKGYSSAALITARPQPRGRLSADPDGVLRLRFVARPPAADAPAARLPADPVTDPIIVGLPLSFQQLSRLTAVEITAADRVITLRR